MQMMIKPMNINRFDFPSPPKLGFLFDNKACLRDNRVYLRDNRVCLREKGCFFVKFRGVMHEFPWPFQRLSSTHFALILFSESIFHGSEQLWTKSGTLFVLPEAILKKNRKCNFLSEAIPEKHLAWTKSEYLRDNSENLRDNSKSFVIMRLTFLIIGHI